jgi:nucleoside-diphosphate-sugar epimerase
MKKILLLGSTGYIGTRLYNELSQYDVTCVDLCWYDTPLHDCIKKDYNDLDESFIQEHDVVILLAGHSSVKMSEGEFTNCFTNNVTNFINLLSKIKHQKFIYASSSSVYGSVGGKTVSEKYYGFKPYNQYDISKHTIDLYAEKSEVEYYGLRFGTVCGYSPIMRNDIMINAMTSNALENGEIKLYIKDIMRPILGINDLCRSIVSIIDCEEDNRGLYNLASFNKTAEQIAYEVSDVINIPVKEYDADPTQVSNTKAQTKCYNFSISTRKFERKFKFKFLETVESITKSIVENYSNIIQTNRSEKQNYVQFNNKEK